MIKNYFLTNIDLILCILSSISILIPLLITIAYFTLLERKAMGSIQRRKGPNVVGIWGFLQPLADGLKLICKEMLFPRKSNILLFIFAPMFTFFLSLLSWIVIPFSTFGSLVNIEYSVLYILAISSLGVYGIILSGWASNSKYALLGSLRAVAQMISYELPITLCVLIIVMLSGSLNLSEIAYAQSQKCLNILPLLPIAVIFFISILAETNRAPFDMAEAEAEIVAGYNLEYSSIIFAMFFLGEYSNMILMSSLFVVFFLGGSYPNSVLGFDFSIFFFATKTVLICFFFVLVRAMLPRYRYDQLMSLGWKVLLPLCLGYFVFSSSLIMGLGLDTNLNIYF